MHRSILLCLAGLALVAGLRDFPSDTGSINLDIYGKHKSECEHKTYRKYVLKLVKETPFAGLFRDVKNQTKFEASDVATVRGKFYVIFDNMMSVGVLDDNFRFRGENNQLVGEPGPESQFEGIAYVPENDTFLLLHESYPGGKTNLKGRENIDPYTPYITTAKLDETTGSYEILSQCPVDFELTHENKGFEAILYLHAIDGKSYMLGLCEGNYCVGGEEGEDPGNGRIVVSQLDFNDDTGECAWDPVKTINIPSSAYFKDYAGMALNYATGKIAVLSQENAAVWIGDFDVDAIDFKSDGGRVYHLPRDNHCEMVYCNAEGVQWLDNYRLVVTSDKAKSIQPYGCGTHDQSIHIFAMPPGWDPYSPATSANEAEDEEEE